MIFLNLICCSLAVALVTADLVSDQDLNEYRLATKRYHRKIRSTESEGFVPLIIEAKEEQSDTDTLVPALPGSVDESSVQPNTSFLLDLPYPSHFLVSLQMLNLSLPFIDTAVNVPEDPPTPNFDLEEVIKNRQQFQPSPPDNSPAGSKSAGIDGPTRRAINRIRHRIPARRLPKRSTQETQPKIRSWNASRPAPGPNRRLELYSKFRSTTTPRPKIKKFQSKLLSRRANATKPEIRKKLPVVPEQPVESTTESPEQQSGSSTTEQPELSDLIRPSVSGTSNRFVFQSPDYESFKTRMGGFRPIKPSIKSDRFRPSVAAGPDRFPPREKFISSPDEQFIPIIPSGQSHDIVTTSTTESIVAKFEFKPSAPLKPQHHLSKYISQFEPKNKKEDSEEATQIQKPEQIDNVNHSGSNDESLIAATSTIVPITDFVPDLNFPSFELPTKDGSKSSTLPPPLSIEELIKKFTGKDLITDPPSSVSSSTPSAQHPSPIQAESIDIVTTKTINAATPSIPESKSLGDLEASLKQLLVVTASVPVQNNSQSSDFIHFEVPTTSTPPTSSTSSSFTLPVLPLPNISPATEKTVFSHPETTTVNPPSPSAGISVNATSDSTNLPVSVQRGPLDVSSFDNSFGSGAVQQGGFNFQSNFQQQQQQQIPAGNFGGYSGANFGGNGGDVAGQQNPYFYGAGLFTGSGGGGGGGGAGQFNQNGFDGTLHYSPTGPPAGEFNAITQGLSLLASFGGPGGGQFAIQQPSVGYQQQSFGDFNPAALQASSQIQSTASLPSFSQGYPSFNLIQQQPQPYPAQSQQAYQLAQFQNYPPHQQQQQPQQQFYPQQQSFQLVAGNPAGANNLYPVQLVQYQPQGSAFQQQPSLPVQQAGPAAINPAQFGTLASGLQTNSFDSSGLTAGTASVSPVSVSSSSNSISAVTSSNSISAGASSSPAAASPKEKSIDAAASQQVEFQLKPVSHSMFADTVAESSNSVQLITIGPENSRVDFDLLKAGSKKSSYKRGLRSGYYP